jgi:hypothetical protein
MQLVPELLPETIIDAVVMEQKFWKRLAERPGGKPPSSSAFLSDTTNKLLMRNRCHLTRFQLLFPPLYFFIRNVHAGRRQRIEKSRGQ